jgi:hypothetical protein
MRTLVAKAAVGNKSAPNKFVFSAFHTAPRFARLERRVNKLSDAKRMFLV